MKIHLKNLEVGVQRLYYLLWAGFYVAFGAAALDDLKRTAYATTPENILLGTLILFAVLVAPWIAMKVIQWVYRGFVPLS